MLMTESAGDRNHNPILHFTSVLNYFSKKVVFCAMSWCWIARSAFYRNTHLGSIHRFQRFSCFKAHPANAVENTV